MNSGESPFSKLNVRFLFLVWGTPDQGPRSRVMADKLGIEVYFIQETLPRGALYAPLKYTLQAIKALLLLFRQRPQVIFVQSPPLFAVLCVCIYCILTGAKYIVDAHSTAFLKPWWTIPPTWLKSFLARRAITTIVTNEHLKQMVDSLGGHAFILRDVPTTFQVKEKYPVEGEFNIALVNVFSPDEPLREVLEAMTDLPHVQLYVTGKLSQKHAKLVDGAPANVHFTDFLPNEAYYSLLNTVQAVMCLTTRNHTMQRGACEALSLGKPIITSDWPLLQTYFHQGTIHVSNTRAAIRQGVLEMTGNYPHYQAGIKELQTAQQQEWQEKVALLLSLIKKSVGLN